MIDRMKSNVKEFIEKNFINNGDLLFGCKEVSGGLRVDEFLLLLGEGDLVQGELASLHHRNQDEPAQVSRAWVLPLRIVRYLHSQLHQDLLAQQQLLLAVVSVQERRRAAALFKQLVNAQKPLLNRRFQIFYLPPRTLIGLQLVQSDHILLYRTAEGHELLEFGRVAAGFGLLYAENGGVLENAGFGMDAEMVLPEVGFVADGELEVAGAEKFARMLQLLSHVDAPLLVFLLAVTYDPGLSCQQLVEGDVAICKQLFGGLLLLALVLPHQDLEVAVVQLRRHYLRQYYWHLAARLVPLQLFALLELYCRESLALPAWNLAIQSQLSAEVLFRPIHSCKSRLLVVFGSFLQQNYGRVAWLTLYGSAQIAILTNECLTMALIE